MDGQLINYSVIVVGMVYTMENDIVYRMQCLTCLPKVGCNLPHCRHCHLGELQVFSS